MVYAAGGNTVSVIDGNPDDGAFEKVVASIPVGGNVTSVAVNPTTNLVYVVDGSIVSVIDGATNEVISTISGSCLTVAAVNPTTNFIYVGQTAVSNECGPSVLVLNGANNQVVATIPLPGNPSDIGVNPVTNLVYVAYGSSVLVINGATNEVTATIPFSGTVYGIAVNPVTNLVYVATGGLLVVNGSTNQIIATLGDVSAGGVGVDPSTNTIYVTNDASLGVVNGGSNQLTDTIPFPNVVSYHNNPLDIGVDPTTHLAYIGTGTDTMMIIDGLTDQVYGTIPSGANSIAVNPVTDTVYSATTSGISVINGATNMLEATIPVELDTQQLAINSRTDVIYALLAGGSVAVIDGTTNQITAILNVSLGAIAVNPVTNTLYGTSTSLNSVVAISGATNQVTATIPIDISNASLAAGPIAVNPTTNMLYVAGWASGVSQSLVVAIDGSTDKAVGNLSAGAGFSPNGIGVDPSTNTIYATNEENDTVTVINGATWQEVTTLFQVGSGPPGGSYPLGVAVDPTTHMVYVSNAASNSVETNNSVSVIDGTTNQLITNIVGITGVVQADMAANPQTDQIYVGNTIINGSPIAPSLPTSTATVTPTNTNTAPQTPTSTSTAVVLTAMPTPTLAATSTQPSAAATPTVTAGAGGASPSPSGHFSVYLPDVVSAPSSRPLRILGNTLSAEARPSGW